MSIYGNNLYISSRGGREEPPTEASDAPDKGAKAVRTGSRGVYLPGWGWGYQCGLQCRGVGVNSAVGLGLPVSGDREDLGTPQMEARDALFKRESRRGTHSRQPCPGTALVDYASMGPPYEPRDSVVSRWSPTPSLFGGRAFVTLSPPSGQLQVTQRVRAAAIRSRRCPRDHVQRDPEPLRDM